MAKDEEDAPDGDAAGEVVQDAVRQAISGLELDGETVEAGKLPELMMQLLSKVVQNVELPTATEPTPNQIDLQDKVREAFNAYILENVAPDAEGDDVQVDADFLETHGVSLVTHMVGAVGKNFVPPEMTLEVPRGSTADGAPPLAVKLDIGGLIGGFFRGLTPEEEPPVPDTVTEETSGDA